MTMTDFVTDMERRARESESGEQMGDLQSSSIVWGWQVAAGVDELNMQIHLMEDAVGLQRSDPSTGLDKRLKRLNGDPGASKAELLKHYARKNPKAFRQFDGWL